MNYSALSSLNYDDCTYKHNLKQSVSVGDYSINQPRVECISCFETSPSTTLNGNGVDVCSDKPLIDVDSELKLISRQATNCPTYQYLPSNKAYCAKTSLPDCRGLAREETRLSNPPCTLRATGWNRWEWHCQNPQDKALVPFDFMISNRLVVKDNHRPCIPQPIDQSHTLPSLNGDDSVYVNKNSCNSMVTDLPSKVWRKNGEYQYYAY